MVPSVVQSIICNIGETKVTSIPQVRESDGCSLSVLVLEFFFTVLLYDKDLVDVYTGGLCL